MLREARQRAGISQRVLAEKSGVPQSTIARIEAGKNVPRVDTLDRLLRTCGYSLEIEPALGLGVERSTIRERLKMSPAERLSRLTQEAQVLEILRSARRRPA